MMINTGQIVQIYLSTTDRYYFGKVVNIIISMDDITYSATYDIVIPNNQPSIIRIRKSNIIAVLLDKEEFEDKEDKQ